MLLERIKDFISKFMTDHPDKDSNWDSWARRFVMGIDKTKDSALRAISLNRLRFTHVSGFPDVDTFEHEPITDITGKYMKYVVRGHISNAVVKWAESTTTTGKTKEAAESEAEMHMITAENLLDFC